MNYFRVDSALSPIESGGRSYRAEPLFVQAGMWLGILETADNIDDTRAHVISKDEADDLKKNGRNFTKSLKRSEPIVPTLPQDTDAEDVEKPETVEEVLLEGKAVVPPDPLSDTPKPKLKPRRRKKK